MIKTYGEWIDITQYGTSGDQVMDILASWKSDSQKLLAEINRLENIISIRNEKNYPRGIPKKNKAGISG